MRLFHSPGNVIKKVFWSPIGLIFFLCVFIYFSLLVYRTLPFALHMKERSEKAAEIYQNSQIRIQTENERRGREQTDEGKARYEKEFYTKLDPDEYVIFLHKEGEINTFNNEEKVEQTVVEVLLQKIKLWWKNL